MAAVSVKTKATFVPFEVDDRPKVSESLFRTVLLPAILAMTKNPQDEESFMTYLKYAFKPINRIDVMDDHDREKRLFWVPQVRYSVETMTIANIATAMDEIINHNSSISASLAAKQLKETLDPIMKVQAPTEEDITQWRYILSRYNLLPPETQITNPSDDDSDMIETTDEYEDW